MHEFAILAFAGLAIALSVRILSTYVKELTRLSTVVLWVGLGVGFAYLANYSIFAAWGIGVRSEPIGMVLTGFMAGGLAMLWEEAISFFRAYTHQEPSKTDKPLRRAA
jgi:hypothetical protein